MRGKNLKLAHVVGLCNRNSALIALCFFWLVLVLWIGGLGHFLLGVGGQHADSLIDSGINLALLVLCVGLTVRVVGRAYRAETDLRKRLYSRLPGVVFTIRPDGHIDQVSDFGLVKLSYKQETLHGLPFTDFASEHEAARKLCQDVIAANGRTVEHEIAVHAHDGTDRWLRLQSRLLHAPSAQAGHIECIGWDISELVAERARRNETEHRLKTLADLSNEALFLHEDGICVDANPAAERMFGYSMDEFRTMSATDIISAETVEWVMQHIHEGFERPYKATAVRKDGSTFPCEITGKEVLIDGRRLRLTTFHNITDRERVADLLQHQATHDALTDLPNRYLFLDRLAFAIKLAKRRREGFALMYIDLDGFKDVNDRYGHLVGDRLLGAAAQSLRETLREVDTVARLGGDEFTTILPGADHSTAATIVAEKLIRGLRETRVPINDTGETIGISASIGIAFYPHTATDLDTLISLADKAMYAAKKSGKAGYRIFPDERSLDQNPDQADLFAMDKQSSPVKTVTD